MHVLGIIAKSVVALAALGGVLYLAKRQMGYYPWQSGPKDPPVTSGGTSTGGPSQTPK